MKYADDLTVLFQNLSRSKFRSRFKLGPREFAYYKDRGSDIIRSHALRFVMERLAPAIPNKDGRQTPTRNHPVFIAQHATATCCRKCLMKWHAIPKNRALNPDEIDYIVNVIMEWLRRKSGSDSE